MRNRITCEVLLGPIFTTRLQYLDSYNSQMFVLIVHGCFSSLLFVTEQSYYLCKDLETFSLASSLYIFEG
jgi:hypothetical protein